ncbi:hypothetical protein D9611_005536 [Ephemerocybe angulata]|uniref:Uncharacterized protein n=1 Tax=Ephemerocybe angulata TaxID=980116 RepID=A0A8H5BIX1_9AGAR|nr:hypothetical protein D9611_005536 [Tulosesus angulatus]
MSITNPEDPSAAEAALSEVELAELQALVGKDLKALLETDDTNDEINYAQVLQRLNSTDAMAQGVEAKLDSILQNLDTMLESLGANAEDGSRAAAASTAPTENGTESVVSKSTEN